ncbi:MAG: transporter substrate-binding domain-containing protein [Bacilli bacterium]
MKSKSIILSVICLSALTLTSCGGGFKTLSEIKTSGTINVSTNAEFAPFEYLDGTELAGVDIDLMKAYAESINVEYKIQNMDFDAALTSVSTNKTDCAIAGITASPARKETLDFSDTYYQANQVVIVKKNSVYSALDTEDAILSALSTNHARIGGQRGTTGQYYVQGDEEWEFDGIADTTFISYDNGASACLALSNGQIDAVIIDLEPAKNYCKKYESLTYLNVALTEEGYAVAFAKGNTTLVESFNSFIATVKENGTLTAILDSYF